MSIVASEYRFAIEHLPPGSVLGMGEVAWGDYERLLAELGPGYAVRIFYDRGRMEAMAPSPFHERTKSIVNTLVTALRDELEIELESLGSTTFKNAAKASGAEPDDCFYIQNASRILGKDDLDMATDPPPDLVVEVERTSASLDKFPIYAALGVPEIWHFTRSESRMYVLGSLGYQESPASRAFPFLTADALSRFVAQARTQGSRAAARAFRAWVREHHRA